MKYRLFILLIIVIATWQCTNSSHNARLISDFGKDWKFNLGDVEQAMQPNFDDTKWRSLDVPHDWSIEGEFSDKNPATPGGGALPGGIGWYRKTFRMNESDREKLAFITFDGVYRNSEVWINGQYLGKRPYGYSTFQYNLTPYLHFGDSTNVIAVKADNSQQPNSRWYSGSGIYRNVWLTVTGKVHIAQWGTHITTPEVTEQSAKVVVTSSVANETGEDKTIKLTTKIVDAKGKTVTEITTENPVAKTSEATLSQEFVVANPTLWSIENPYLYKVVSVVECNGKVTDSYETPLGIRYFNFDSQKGFSLNGKPVKLLGVCNHHDLGCLGAAINPRAIERQLELLKGMGCNAIRTSHNPPAPELLDLCDKMGFIVMDEAFDMWRKKKTEFDYHLDFDEWHKRDLEDLVRRDRNHPSVFIWSIGNEIPEQWDSTGVEIAKELAGIVKNLDNTRPITSACNDPQPYNNIIKSGALDLIGYNYHHQMFDSFPMTFPNQKFIGAETTSALATRGEYDMPSDVIRRWPVRWDLPFTTGNPDNTCSAYDNCSAPWGSTHEESWRLIKKYDFLSGLFIWTGFDYLGEPTPYTWPSRSSYFGIFDLAGFPKDAYYLYKSEWTKEPVLHVFPHWNWNEGDTVDVWVYSNTENIELFLNGESLGAKDKPADSLHLTWRVLYKPGTLKAIAKTGGKEVLTQEVKTAGKAAKIVLSADRLRINADGRDLSYITIDIVDDLGVIVPKADNLVNFTIEGDGAIIAVDNGDPVSHESFKAKSRKAFNGKCLAVIQAGNKAGTIKLTAKSEGLQDATIELTVK